MIVFVVFAYTFRVQDVAHIFHEEKMFFPLNKWEELLDFNQHRFITSKTFNVYKEIRVYYFLGK